MNEKHKIIDLKNDLLFKFTFGKEDEISKKLLKIIIEGALDIQVKELTIMNPDLSPSHLEDRDLILDIKVRDEKENLIDVEMQCYGPSERFYRRFALYGYKMAGELYKEGEIFSKQKKAYQILFIDSLNPQSDDLIRRMKMRDENGIEDKTELLERTYVYIKQMKEYEPMNLFKSLVYLFNHPENCDKLKTGNEMMSMVAEKINEFNEDEELADLAYKRKLNQIYLDTLEKEAEEARKIKEEAQKIKEEAQKIKEEAEQKANEAQQRENEAEQKANEAQQREKEAEEQMLEYKRQADMTKSELNKVNLLNRKLKEENRMDDLLKSFDDPDFQKKLFKEFGLE